MQLSRGESISIEQKNCVFIATDVVWEESILSKGNNSISGFCGRCHLRLVILNGGFFVFKKKVARIVINKSTLAKLVGPNSY